MRQLFCDLDSSLLSGDWELTIKYGGNEIRGNIVDEYFQWELCDFKTQLIEIWGTIDLLIYAALSKIPTKHSLWLIMWKKISIFCKEEFAMLYIINIIFFSVHFETCNC